MKKTIKYGSLVASAAAAVAAMGASGSAYAATTVNNTTCEITHSSTADVDPIVAGDYETVADFKAAQAEDYEAQANCYAGRAQLKAEAIEDLNGKTNLVYTAGDITADTTNAVIKNVKRDAQAIVTVYGTNDFSDATLYAKLGKGSLDVNTPWNLAKNALETEAANQNVEDYVATDAEIYNAIIENIEDDGDSYNSAEIIAEFEEAEAAADVVELADEYINLVAEKKAVAKTAETLRKESDAAHAVDVAQDAVENVDDAVERAQNAIDSLDATSAIARELQAALNAVKDGEVTEDDAIAVTNAVDDAEALKQETAEDKAEAQALMDEAKAAEELADLNMGTLTNEAAREAAQQVVNEYGSTTFTDDVLKAKLGKGTVATAENPWNRAVATLEALDQPYSENDIFNAIKADAEQDNTFGGRAIIEAFNRAKAADAAVKAINAFIAAEAADEAADKALTAANEIVNAKAAADAAQQAIEAAREAVEDLGEDSTFGKQLTAVIDGVDPATSNQGTGETFTYSVLNGSDAIYTAQSGALSFRFDAPYAGFLYADIDGKRIPVTAKEGSTIITVAKEVLDTLSDGKHTLTAHFLGDKVAVARFTVATNGVKVKAPNTGVYTKEVASVKAGTDVSALVSAIVTATLAGTAVVIRKRVF